MSEWKEIKLGDVITFQRGHDLPKTNMVKGKFVVAGSNGIIGFHNKSTTKGPGVTIGRSGNIGTPMYYPMDYWAHNTVLYIKDFKNSFPKISSSTILYLSFALIYFAPSVERLTVSVVPSDEPVSGFSNS